MKQFILIIAALCFSTYCLGQAPAIQWQKCFGGSYGEIPNGILQTADGGYLICGSTTSVDGQVTGLHDPSSTNSDVWLVKTDASGNLKWQKCLGGSGSDAANAVIQAADGSYVFVANTNSLDGDVTGDHGSDVWVVKVDTTGNIIWEKCFGGSLYDGGSAIRETSDHGFIVCGSTASNDGDVSGNHMGQGFPTDVWIFKVSNTGSLLWQKCYGGTSYEEAVSIQQTVDGGFIAVGQTGSNDGDVTGNHGQDDYWLIKLDPTGNLSWAKCFGGSQAEWSGGVQQCSDQSYILAGYSNSHDGDVTGILGSSINYWIVKVGISGNLLWEKSYGGGGGLADDRANSVTQTPDGGYLAAGLTNYDSIPGNVSGIHGTWYTSDAWVIKLNTTGALLWEKCFGGTGNETAQDVILTHDGALAFTGYTESNDGDVSGNHGSDDFWVVKTGNISNLTEYNSNIKSISIHPNPSTGIITIERESQDFQSIKIIDFKGEVVYSGFMEGSGASKFDIGYLQNGMYLFIAGLEKYKLMILK